MCASKPKTKLEQLEELESEIAHLIADALFAFLQRQTTANTVIKSQETVERSLENANTSV